MFIVKSDIKCLLKKLGVLTLNLHTNALYTPLTLGPHWRWPIAHNFRWVRISWKTAELQHEQYNQADTHKQMGPQQR